MGADYSFYVKSIATCAPTFFGYIISVLASVSYVFALYVLQHYDNLLPVFVIVILYRIEYLSLADCCLS